MVAFEGRRNAPKQQNEAQNGRGAVIHGMRGRIATGVTNRKSKNCENPAWMHRKGAMRWTGGGEKEGVDESALQGLRQTVRYL